MDKKTWIDVYNHITLLSLALQFFFKALLVSPFSYLIFSLPTTPVLLYGSFNSIWFLVSIVILIYLGVKRDQKHIRIPAIFCTLAVLEFVLMYMSVSNTAFVIFNLLPNLAGVVIVYKIIKQESDHHIGIVEAIKNFLQGMEK